MTKNNKVKKFTFLHKSFVGSKNILKMTENVQRIIFKLKIQIFRKYKRAGIYAYSMQANKNFFQPDSSNSVIFWSD